MVSFYRAPPAYNREYAMFTGAVLPWALVLHLGTAVWMLGNTQLFAPVRCSAAIVL